ncbi:serine-rich adhesin for platelets-like [Penaeus chinensis]|uniref:serine-rich adhesin for platelets-like n=1 Tax=Penaeus chinensis TaxID=139456 RepID=UPI001FB66DBB|nr:serine-rich adhesin for platelets-like [Penaeus chinensis]
MAVHKNTSLPQVCVEDLGSCASTGDSSEADDNFGNNSGSFGSTDVTTAAITYAYSDEDNGYWKIMVPNFRKDYSYDTTTNNRNKGSLLVPDNRNTHSSNISRGMGTSEGDGTSSDGDDKKNATTRFMQSRRLVISPPCLPCHQWDGVMYCRPVFGCVHDTLLSKMEDAACRPCFQRNDLNNCERIKGCIIPILHGAPNAYQGGVVLPPFRQTTTPSSTRTSRKEAVDPNPPPTKALAPTNAAAVVPLLKTFLTTPHPQGTPVSRPAEASQSNRVSGSASNHVQRITVSYGFETTRHEIENDASFGASSATSVVSESHATQSDNQARPTLTEMAEETSGMSFISERSQAAGSSSEILETSEMPVLLSEAAYVTATPNERTTVTTTVSFEISESTFTSETESTATSYRIIELTSAATETTHAFDLTSAEMEATYSEESVATKFGLESTSTSSGTVDLNPTVSETTESISTSYEMIESTLKSETESSALLHEITEVTVSVSEMIESTVVSSEIPESTFLTSEVIESTTTSEKELSDTPCARLESTYISSDIAELIAASSETTESTSQSSQILESTISEITESAKTTDSESSGKLCERRELTVYEITESTATPYGNTIADIVPASSKVAESPGVSSETPKSKITPFRTPLVNDFTSTATEATSEKTQLTATSLETPEPTEPERTATTSEMMESTATSLETSESTGVERTVSTATSLESANLISSSCEPIESSQLSPTKKTEANFITSHSKDTLASTGFALAMYLSTVIHQRSPGTASADVGIAPSYMHRSHPDVEEFREEATGLRPEVQFFVEASGLITSESANQEATLTTLEPRHAKGFLTPHAKHLYKVALVTSKTPNPDAEVFTMTQIGQSNTESSLMPKTPNLDAEVFITSRKKPVVTERLIVSETSQTNSQSAKPL